MNAICRIYCILYLMVDWPSAAYFAVYRAKLKQDLFLNVWIYTRFAMYLM